jgi:hypothetical protein
MKISKVHHIYYGYGWMFGRRPTLFFWGKQYRLGNPLFYVIDAYIERNRLTYASGKLVFDRGGNVFKNK